MSGKFITRASMTHSELDWGTTAWISGPDATQAGHLTTMEVTLHPGKGHDFHLHPDQEEVIYVVAGRIEQWLETQCTHLEPGESVFIPAGLVHASFNVGDGPARILVTLGPCVGESGYSVVDMAHAAPWNTLR